MLVETDNLVSVEEFVADLEGNVHLDQKGRGPIAITKDSKVLGFFLTPSDYEDLIGQSIKSLLKSRERGRKVSQQEARSAMRETARRVSRRSSAE